MTQDLLLDNGKAYCVRFFLLRDMEYCLIDNTFLSLNKALNVIHIRGMLPRYGSRNVTDSGKANVLTIYVISLVNKVNL